jgi:hypothetical protein
LLTEWQAANDRNGREKINHAREAAEALFKFKPGQQTRHAAAPDVASSAEHEPRRQPRIFMIPPQLPMKAEKVEARVEPSPICRTPVASRKIDEIPASQLGRVRALTNYGMTRVQVAELYGVAVGEIDRICGCSTRSRPASAR